MKPEVVSTNYSAPYVFDADIVERSIDNLQAVGNTVCVADRFADCQRLGVDRFELVLPARQTDTDHVACLDRRNFCSMTSIMMLRHPQLLELDEYLHRRTDLRLQR